MSDRTEMLTPGGASTGTTDATATGNRRAFLSKAAVLAAGGAAAGLFAPGDALAVSPPLTFADIPGTGDVKVLNYALALEALETDLYVQAIMRLTTGGTNALGRRISGLGLGNDRRAVRLMRLFGRVEREHRDLLDAALGGESLLRRAPFNRARFDFGFERASAERVLDVVYIAERTGVSAYLGAIPFFQTKTFLPVAGAIVGTEARHTAVIADEINDNFDGSINVAPLARQNQGRDTPLEPNQVLQRVSPFIVL